MNIIDRNRNMLLTRCHLPLTLHMNERHCQIQIITVDYIQAKLATGGEQMENNLTESKTQRGQVPPGVNLPP